MLLGSYLSFFGGPSPTSSVFGWWVAVDLFDSALGCFALLSNVVKCCSVRLWPLLGVCLNLFFKWVKKKTPPLGIAGSWVYFSFYQTVFF